MTTFVFILSSCSTIHTAEYEKPLVITDKLNFTEGPIWTGEKYIFSDIPSSKLYQYEPISKMLSIYKENSHFSNGLFVKDGIIYSAQHDRSVAKHKIGKESVVIALNYKGKKLNSPNDLFVVDEGIFFTDPNYGIVYKGFGPKLAKQEQKHRGVYFINKDGEMKQIISNLVLPNGITYKDHMLYVADSSNGSINKYELDNAFNVISHNVMTTVRNGENVMADGIEVGPDNHLYVAGPGAIYVYSLDGKLVKKILVDSEHVSNIAFGGESGEDLMVTAKNKVFLYKSY